MPTEDLKKLKSKLKTEKLTGRQLRRRHLQMLDRAVPVISILMQ